MFDAKIDGKHCGIYPKTNGYILTLVTLDASGRVVEVGETLTSGPSAKLLSNAALAGGALSVNWDFDLGIVERRGR